MISALDWQDSSSTGGGEMEIDFQDEKTVNLEVISQENSQTSSFPGKLVGFSQLVGG